MRLRKALIAGLSTVLLLGCPAAEDTQAESRPSPSVSTAATVAPAVTPAFTLLTVNAQTLEPVARYVPAQRRFEAALPERAAEAPVSEEGDAEAIRQLIPLTATYPVYWQGQKIQTFQPERLDPPGCGDYPQVAGQLDPPMDETQSFQGLAYAPMRNLPALQPPAAPALAEQAEMGAMLKTAYFAQGNRSAQESSFELTGTHTFPFQKAAGQPFDLGLFVTGRRKNNNPQALCDQETFWVLGLWEQGRAVPLASYQQPKSEYAEDCQSSDVVSSFVVDQALDHVLVRHNAYESWSYTIYAWRQDTWEKVFAGGGGGC